MTNIDRIREMSEEELAAFLTEVGAEVPGDFCENCKLYGTTDCGTCRYLDESTAWEEWLERKVTDGKEKEPG